MTLGRTAKFYRKNKASYKKKLAADKAINARPEQVKKRVESNRARRIAKRKGQKIKGKDYDHAVGRFVSAYTNRSRSEKSRLKGSKRK